MCYHNSLKKEAKEISEYYDAPFEEKGLFHPIFHASGFTFPNWPIVSIEAQKKIITLAEWGLIPSWALNRKEANQLRTTLLNARSETIFEKVSFKRCMAQHRCLIPSTGYYEWQKVDKKRYPYFITLRSREMFSIAGIVHTWFDSETKNPISTFAMITTEANSCLEKIHNTKKRMPLILAQSDENNWLEAQLSVNEIKHLMKPFPSDEFQYHTVGNLVSNVAGKNSNVEEVCKPYNYPEFQQQSLF